MRQRATMEFPPSKMVRWQLCSLVFEGGDGGGVAKEQPPSKKSGVWSVSKVEMVVVLPWSDHPRK